MRPMRATVGQMELLGDGRNEVYTVSCENKRKLWVVDVVQEWRLQQVHVGGMALI